MSGDNVQGSGGSVSGSGGNDGAGGGAGVSDNHSVQRQKTHRRR